MAQPKPTQAQIQAAGDLVKKAIAKSQAGDHTLAIELYQQAAAQLNVAVPAEVMRSSTLMDGAVWDGKDPQGYAASFEVHARCKELGSVPM